jgi:hypothetical protein
MDDRPEGASAVFAASLVFIAEAETGPPYPIRRRSRNTSPHPLRALGNAPKQARNHCGTSNNDFEHTPVTGSTLPATESILPAIGSTLHILGSIPRLHKEYEYFLEGFE